MRDEKEEEKAEAEESSLPEGGYGTIKSAKRGKKKPSSPVFDSNEAKFTSPSFDSNAGCLVGSRRCPGTPVKVYHWKAVPVFRCLCGETVMSVKPRIMELARAAGVVKEV